MYVKNNFSGFLGKGFNDKLIGGAKGLAHVLDNSMVGAGISAIAPEIGAGLAAAKKFGLLEKMKHL